MKTIFFSTEATAMTSLLFALFTHAWALKTAYVSFDHPDGWRCELSQGVWICQSTQEPDRKESVVLSIATTKTEWDTLDNYLEYLKKPRPVQDEDGKQLMSKVTYARKRSINGIDWIDSLQYNSELPGFWARYLATVRDKLAILITYIVSDEYYSKLAPQFERMASSLKPNAEIDLNFASQQGDATGNWNERLGKAPDLGERLNLVGKSANLPPKSNPELPAEDQGSSKWLLLIGLAAAVGYVIVRRRRKKTGEGN